MGHGEFGGRFASRFGGACLSIQVTDGPCKSVEASGGGGGGGEWGRWRVGEGWTGASFVTGTAVGRGFRRVRHLWSAPNAGQVYPFEAKPKKECAQTHLRHLWPGRRIVEAHFACKRYASLVGELL